MPYIPLAQRGRSNNSQVNSLDEFKTRIGNRESGGNYGAMGPEVKEGMYAGDRAVGKYQVMGMNVPDWTREALGRSMTADEFKNSPEAQEAVATKRFTDIYNKYGNWEDVASVWFTGKPKSEAGGDVADVLGTTNKDYIASIVGGMGEGLNQLGQAAGKYIPMAMRAAQNVAQTAAKAPFRLSQVPEDIVRGIQGQEPTQPFDVPLLGEVKSYARQAVDDTPEMGAFPAGLKAVSEGVLDAAAIGGLAQGAVDSLTPKAAEAVPLQPIKAFGNELEAARAHLSTGKQILEANPQAPLADILKNTQDELMGGLRMSKFDRAADAVSRLNVKNFSSYDDFSNAAEEAVKNTAVLYEPALAGLALPLMGDKGKELDISSLKFPEPVSQEAVNAVLGNTGLEGGDIPKIYEPVKVIHEFTDKFGKVFILKDGETVRPVGRFKGVVGGVYEDHPNLPPGLIEAILQKESSMGTDDRNRNKKIGEYAWLVGFTPGAKDALDRAGIDYDLDTKSGAIRAAGEYLSLRQKEVDKDGNVTRFYSDPQELYFERYAKPGDKKLYWDKFGKFISFYGRPKNKDVLYLQDGEATKMIK